MANRVLDPMLTDRFAQALAFANAVHARQQRKSTMIPYVSHVLGVASLVLEHGGDEDTAIAALLHDAPEDQGGYEMLAEIKARFGDRVAKIVEGCTDTFEDPKPDWLTRKEKYLAHLADSQNGADLATCIVSVADKLHNARSILHDLRNRVSVGVKVFERFNTPQEQQGWYFGRLARVLHERLAGEDAEALAVALLHAIDDIGAHNGCYSFAKGVASGFHGEPCPPNKEKGTERP